MNTPKKITGIALALLMILGGIAHFLSPETYFGLIPDFLPKEFTNWMAGIVELLLGIGYFIPGYRRKSLLGIFALMIVFLPVHIADALREDPVIGSHTVAYIRILIQFVLIWLPWYALRSDNSIKE